MTVFTSSTTFTVPKGVKEIEVFAVGGGSNSGADGGGGGYTKTEKLSVQSLDEISISIGSGADSALNSLQGGDTIVDGVYGYGAIPNWKTEAHGPNGGFESGAGCGGSGGGAHSYGNLTPGNGGSDGGNGENGSKHVENMLPSAWATYGGKGQGTTTRAFGESEGTLYAGGGGGSGDYGFGSVQAIGRGGAGGGGNGRATGTRWDNNTNSYNYQDYKATDGGINTGGGAGGYGAKGGSGIAIIRWGY